MENLKLENKDSLQQRLNSLNFKIGELKSKINVETNPEEKKIMITECGKLLIERDLLESKAKQFGIVMKKY